jgi:fructoselysine-6-phosphate deglycase
MLNFDPDRFLRIQRGALELAGGLMDCVHSQAESNGIETVYFLGAGGANILMLPAAQLLQSESTVTSYAPHSAELVEVGSRRIGEQTLVIAPSLSGTTQETVQVLELCRDRGATTIALTGHADTPVAKAAENVFVNFAEDDTSSETFYVQSLVIALAVMNERSELADLDQIVGELAKLPEALLAAKELVEPHADYLARALASDSYHIVSGAGNCWAEALYYGMCILEEMQWIRTRPVHASDFFHGTLELVEPGVSVLLFKGEDTARPLVDRVERFARERTGKVHVLDTRDYPLAGLSDRTRALVSPMVLATVLERISAHLEVITDHPLTTRRYYRKVSY